MAAHVFERLPREQKTLEANIAVPAVQHQRVDQGINDQIVLPISRTKKVAAVVKMNLNTLVPVWMIGMMRASQTVDRRIDFNCVDVFCVPLQGPADIIT